MRLKSIFLYNLKLNGDFVRFAFALNVIFSFGLLSLFNGISTIMSYLMPKPFLLKNSLGIIKPIAVRNKGFHAFHKVISMQWYRNPAC